MQDYPSIAQLHEKLQQSQVQPIFAVTTNVIDLYSVSVVNLLYLLYLEGNFKELLLTI